MAYCLTFWLSDQKVTQVSWAHSSLAGVVNDLQQKKTNKNKTKQKKLSKRFSIGVVPYVQRFDDQRDTNHSLKRPPCNHLAHNRKFHCNSDLNISRLKVNYGGDVAMWFSRALDL